MKPLHLRARQHFSVISRAVIFVAWLGANSLLAAVPTYYWDTNGTNDGPGTSPSAIWSNSSLTWTLDPYGTTPTFIYDTRANIVFAASGDAYWAATADYKVSVQGTALVSDIIFKSGNATVSNLFSILDKDTANIGVLNDDQVATIYSVIASATGTSNGLLKYATGRLILGGTNTYRGPTTIEGGFLSLARPQVLPRTSTLILGNGGTEGYFDTPPTLELQGFSQTLGPLLLNGPEPELPRTIDFGYGAAQLAFANSSTQDWGGIPLTIVHFDPTVNSLRFGTNALGLTDDQLQLIQFKDFANVPGQINSQGFVTPLFPKINSLVKTGPTTYLLTWNAVAGQRYQIQYRNSVSSAWQLGDSVTPDTTIGTYEDNVGQNTNRFYRLRMVVVGPPS